VNTTGWLKGLRLTAHGRDEVLHELHRNGVALVVQTCVHGDLLAFELSHLLTQQPGTM
jgi:hypothetical protein